MTEKKLESISALLDDELKQTEFESTLANEIDQSETKATYSRYSLIGDVMRNEQQILLGDEFSKGVQEAISEIKATDKEKTSDNVASISSHPAWLQRAKRLVAGQSGKAFGQFAIAASVALVAVVGVNNMESTDKGMSSPVISTAPLINGVSPVSVASDNVNSNKPSANQITQYRIDALIADHHQQLKINGHDDEKSDEDKSSEDK